MNSLLFAKYRPVIFLVLWFASVPIFADTGTIRGSAFDHETAQPLQGATVLLMPRVNALTDEILYAYGRNRASLTQLTGEMAQETQRAGAIVQKDGSFVIKNVKVGDYTLTVRYTGYKRFAQEVSVKASETITIPEVRLALDPQGLEEVVITGVGSQREKSRAEVAVSRVDVLDLMETKGNQYQDVSQILMGKMAGLQVLPSSGNLGSGVRFAVRSGAGLAGVGNPTVYVDGLRLNFDELTQEGGSSTSFNVANYIGGQGVSTLADISPFDIETIEALKGPAASAMYGTQGSNGVVLITTKHGSRTTNGTVSLNFRITQGWNEQARPYTEAMFRSYKDANSVFQTGALNEYNVSLSASSPSMRVYTSFNHRSEQGTIAPNALYRTQGRINAEFAIAEQFFLRVGGSYTATRNNRILGDLYSISSLSSTMLLGPDSAGNSRSFEKDPYYPFPLQYLRSIKAPLDIRHLLASAELEYKPLPGLTLRGVVGLDHSERIDNLIIPRLNDPDAQAQFPDLLGTVKTLRSDLDAFNFDLSAAYSYEFARWGLQGRTVLGAQGYIKNFEGLSSKDSDLPYVLAIGNVGAKNQYSYTPKSQFREAGIFVQQEFSLDDRYFFSAGIRNDYSSTIGRNAPSVFYPRASAAVRLDHVTDFPTVLNLCKLRAGYGESGVLPGAEDASPAVWENNIYPIGSGLAIFQQGNPNVEPERISEFEIGLDAEIAGKYGIELTYYLQNSRNSLVRVPLAPSTGLRNAGSNSSQLEYGNGVQTIAENGASLTGWGVEMMLYATPLREREFQLDARCIVNYADTRITALLPGSISSSLIGNSLAPYLGGINPVTNVVGQPREIFYFPKVLGARFAANGVYAGPIFDSLSSVIGRSSSPFTGSVSLSFRCFTDVTLSVLADWAVGQSVFMQNASWLRLPIYENNATVQRLVTQLGIAEQRYATPLSGVAELQPGTPEYKQAATEYAQYEYSAFANSVHRGDFIRLRELSLSYNASRLLQSWFGESAVQSCVLAVSVRNVALWTVYPFVDPEVSLGTSQPSRTDTFTLPHPRVINFSLSLGL